MASRSAQVNMRTRLDGSSLSVSVVSFSSVLEAFCSCLRRCRSCRNCVAVSSTSDVSMESASRSSGRPSSDSSSSVSNCVKFENRVSSSSGDSTFVMMTTIFSEESGMASTINGISSASNPKSMAACCIISRNKARVFSEP